LLFFFMDLRFIWAEDDSDSAQMKMSVQMMQIYFLICCKKTEV
jgi:hypothetical protein